jgi:hypothetical protein
MAQAVTISLSKFTSSVQSAVKAAVDKHPKFKFEVPQSISVSFLIWGFPPAEAVVANATLGETQAFVNDVASHIASAHPAAFARANPGTEGAVLSLGRHVICGIPPATHIVVEK